MINNLSLLELRPRYMSRVRAVCTLRRTSLWLRFGHHVRRKKEKTRFVFFMFGEFGGINVLIDAIDQYRLCPSKPHDCWWAAGRAVGADPIYAWQIR
jgi:hypothetical protein